MAKNERKIRSLIFDTLGNGSRIIKTILKPSQGSSIKDYNKHIYRIIYIFMGLFLLIIGYFTYFQVARSSDVINNAYNHRQDVLEKKVLRGDILASGGEILAETILDEDGNEIRHYPYGDMFTHVVGRDAKGISGIEEAQNIRLLTADINSIKKIIYELAGQKNIGNSVVTTLDVKLQEEAYKALGKHRGAVIAMEPDTGRILAMVSKPTYDPNNIDEIWEDIVKNEEESPLLNRATQGLYPPGSTFKLLISLAYIRENPSYLDYEYDCDSTIEYENMVIHCAGGIAHGKVDLMESLAKSCNTSFAHIGTTLDLSRFYGLCEQFLFNKSLPIAMASSVSKFSLQADAGQKDVMQTAIGQGNTKMSPLHNAMIISTIANGGTMMKPYVVDHIENADGQTLRKYSPQAVANLLTEEEAGYLSQMLREVVENGTAKDLKDLDVAIAGKTGSAEQQGKAAHAWFIGYAPYDDPQIAVCVIVENVGSGSDYAVPIARRLFQAYFK